MDFKIFYFFLFFTAFIYTTTVCRHSIGIRASCWKTPVKNVLGGGGGVGVDNRKSFTQ